MIPDTPDDPSSVPTGDAKPATTLVSFVVRFVCAGAPAAGAGPGTSWHGLIRHVQSDAERYFTRWPEAEAFMGQFVGLGE